MTRNTTHTNGRFRLGVEQLESREVPAGLVVTDPVLPEPTGVGESLSNAVFVTHLYQDVLGRNPDAGGYTGWVNALDAGSLSRVQVADGFLDSTEYRANVLISYYATQLGRNPDAGGFNDHMAQLAAGVSRDEVRAKFFGSEEFFNRYGRNDSAFVAQLYAQILGRTGTVGELSHWLNVLAQNGGDRTAVAHLFLNSAEYHQDQVTLAYAAYLHRGPDAPGFVDWNTQLNAGLPVETMTVQFLGSAEYFVRL